MQAQILDLDDYLSSDSLLFVSQENNYLKLNGTYLLPTTLLQGQQAFSSLGIYYNRIYMNVPSQDKKGIIKSNEVRRFSKFGILVPLGKLIDISMSWKKYDKIGSSKPYSYTVGLSYNFFSRFSRSHFNLITSYGETKNVEDFYIKSFYVGALYKSLGYRMDYVLNFGINRVHAKVFPNEHPEFRKSKIFNVFLYQLGLNVHISKNIHLQGSYLKSIYSGYMIGLLLTSR